MRMRNPSYFADLIQTLYYYYPKVHIVGLTFWATEALKLRNKSLSITLKSSRTPLFHTSLSKKQRTEWFVCLSHTGGYIFVTSFVRDAIGNPYEI